MAGIMCVVPSMKWESCGSISVQICGITIRFWTDIISYGISFNSY